MLSKSTKLKKGNQPKTFEVNYNLFAQDINFRYENRNTAYQQREINKNNEQDLIVYKVQERRTRRQRVIYPELIVDQLERFYDTYSL